MGRVGDLDTLRAAVSLVALGRYGYAAATNPALEAYQALKGSPRAELHAELIAMARDGTPAARVYGALLVGAEDERLGRRLLEAMLGSDAECTLAQGGCTMIGETLDEVAAFLLGREPTPAVVGPRRLRREVESMASAPGYIAPDWRGKHRNGWAESFAHLLGRHDLALARAEIEALAASQPPAALYGATLLARLDPARGRARLVELTGVSGTVRLLFSDRDEASVAEVARALLDRIARGE
jgi:hypothetical protein